MSVNPESSNDSVDEAVEKVERTKSLLRVSRGMKRDLGAMNVALKPETVIVYSPAGLDSPVLVFVQSNNPDQTITIGLRIGDIDLQGTPGLGEFLLRENAELVFGRLQLQSDTLILEHHLVGLAPARRISIVAICLADTAIRLISELKRLGALTVVEEDA